MWFLLPACVDAPSADSTLQVEADPCEEPGNVCTWLGVPETGMFSGEGTDRSADFDTGTFLSLPMDITFAPDGTAYFAELNNNRVRTVSTDDHVTTIAGLLTGEPSEFCEDGCPASTAIVHHPASLAVDAQNQDDLWVGASAYVDRVEVAHDTLFLEAQGFAVAGVVSHPDGSLYVGDVEAQVIRRIAPDGTVEVVGPDPSGLLLEEGPGLALDGDLLYVADTGNGLVRSIDLAACAGDRTACVINVVNGAFDEPRDVAVGLDGALYVADRADNCVWVVRDGLQAPFAGQCGALRGYSGDGGPATDALLSAPSGVAVDPDGSVFVADTDNQIIRRVIP